MSKVSEVDERVSPSHREKRVEHTIALRGGGFMRKHLFWMGLAVLVSGGVGHARIYQRWVPQATAQCGDGTFTDSTDRTTCSRNGGVRQWLGGSSRSRSSSATPSATLGPYRPVQTEFIERQRRAMELRDLWAAYRHYQTADSALRRPSPSEMARAARLSSACMLPLNPGKLTSSATPSLSASGPSVAAKAR